MLVKSDKVMKILDNVYKDLCRWDIRSAINDNPIAAMILFMFLKFISDNKEKLNIEFEEKYQFDFMLLLYGEKITHSDLVSHISSVEEQLGFRNRILKRFVEKMDLSKFNQEVSEILKTINSLEVDFANDKNLMYEAIVNYISLQSKKEIRLATEYTTDLSLSKLMSYIVDINDGMSIYDFASGYGVSLVEVAKEKDVKVFAQDISEECAAVSIMLLIMSWNVNAEVLCGDSISEPLTAIKNQERVFDRIVSAPPFGLRKTDAGKMAIELSKFFEYGTEYKLTGDLVFARHVISSLKENGVGVLQIPMGALFRGGVEEKIRAQMIEDNYIHAVIELPAGIVAGTNVKTALVIFMKNRTTEDIFVLDLARDAAKNYIERSGRAGMTIVDSAISEIGNIIRERKVVEGLSARLSKGQVADNGTNLCPGTYLHQAIIDKIEIQDKEELCKRKKVLGEKLEHLNKRFEEALRRLEE